MDLVFSMAFFCSYDDDFGSALVTRRSGDAHDPWRQQIGIHQELDHFDVQMLQTINLRKVGQNLSDRRQRTGGADRELKGHSEEICKHTEAGKGTHLPLLPRSASPGTYFSGTFAFVRRHSACLS